ncbi:MAG: PKD domain-containing protein [Chitinophagales bacterium]|nr:PKD domain-containing protein [Chitinophagales bacterium]
MVCLLFSATAHGQCYFIRTYDNNGNDDFGRDIIRTYDGFAITGESFPHVGIPSYNYLLEIGPCGDSLWSMQYRPTVLTGGCQPNAIFQLPDSSFRILSLQYDSIEGAGSGSFTKISKTGDSLYHVLASAGYNDRLNDGLNYGKNGFIAVGLFNVLPPNGQCYLAVMDSNGTIQQQRSYGDTTQRWYAKHLIPTADKGFLISGDTRTGLDQQLFMLKVDSTLNEEWRREYGIAGLYQIEGYGQQLADGGYLLAGAREYIVNSNDGYLVKTSPNGAVLWERLYHDSIYPNLYFHAAKEMADGSIIIAGDVYDDFTVNPTKDLHYLAKLDAGGNMLWKRYLSPVQGRAYSYTDEVLIEPGGDIILMGFSSEHDRTVFNVRHTDVIVIRADSCGYSEFDTTVALFALDSVSGTTAHFSDLSSVVCSAQWSYGDGSYSTSFQPSHAYPDTGTYSVTLITRAANLTDTFSMEVRVPYTDTCGYMEPGTARADFVGSVTGNTASFDFRGTDYCSFIWYFGDGDSSLTLNPSHTYTDTGYYYVSLICRAGISSDTLTKRVRIRGTVGVEDAEELTGVRVYPNPANDVLVIELEQSKEADLVLYDMVGRAMLKQTIRRGSNTIDVSALAEGLYIYRIGETTGKINVLHVGK